MSRGGDQWNTLAPRLGGIGNMDKEDNRNGKVPRRGPKPDFLKIDGDWAETIRKALKKKPPEDKDGKADKTSQ